MLLGSHDNTVMEIGFSWKGETQVLSTVALNEGAFLEGGTPIRNFFRQIRQCSKGSVAFVFYFAV